jgi:FAD/FMN-containing dehydrogenase
MSAIVNDIHSELNETTMREIVAVTSVEQAQDAIRQAAASRAAIAIAGGRHAMGGQQFCTDGVLLDMRRLDGVVSLDMDAGVIVVQAGIEWPALVEYLGQRPGPEGPPWAIRQKQTGADRLSIGGALAANAHGRGLT